MIPQLSDHYDKEFAIYKLWNKLREVIEAVNRLENRENECPHIWVKYYNNDFDPPVLERCSICGKIKDG